MKTLRKLLRDERGTETVEWALVLGVIVLTAVMAAVGAKGSMKTIFTSLNSELTTAATP